MGASFHRYLFASLNCPHGHLTDKRIFQVAGRIIPPIFICIPKLSTCLNTVSIVGLTWSPIWKAGLGTVRILPFILNLMQSNPRNSDGLCVAQFPAEGLVGLLRSGHGEGCPYGLASGLGCLPVCFIFYQSIRCFALQGDCFLLINFPLCGLGPFVIASAIHPLLRRVSLLISSMY